MLKFELSFRGLVVVGLALLSIWLLAQIWSVVLLVIVAFIFMAALLPYVQRLVAWHIPRPLAVVAVLLILLAIIGGLFAIIVPAMIDEFTDLREHLPEYAQDLEDFLADFNIQVELSDYAKDIDWGNLISGRVAVDYTQRVVFGVLSAVTIIVLTAYLLNDAPRMKRYLFRFIPDHREDDASHLLQAMERVVGGYIRGQIITSLIISIFTMTVLLILGVKNAVAFGVLAGFADIIPLIGAFIAILPATVGAFQESPTHALIVLIALLLYQQFEDRFLVPRVYGSTLGLQPMVVFVAVLAGGELLGIPGILLALPAAAAGKVLIDLFLDKRDPSNAFSPRFDDQEILAPDTPPAPDS